MLEPMDASVLPPGIRARFVTGVNGLDMHVLEAGFETPGRPCVLLLHGFPELAYSWRALMPLLAAAGFHVVAPDQRGYGRTIGWDADYDGEVRTFHLLNIVRDALGLVTALGYREVAAVIGHDFGSPVAAWCALIRPDVFRAVAMMSAPFGGPPPLRTPPPDATEPPARDVHAELAALPRPRKHYQWYYSTRAANADMQHAPQGLHDFLRAYFHYKSADWKGNQPFPLTGWSAEELAKMPTYYVMDLDQDMAQTVAAEMPSAAEIAACAWLPEEALRVYSSEFERTGFQGGLQWYRCTTDSRYTAEFKLFSGRTIDVPACFIAGRSDWGIYQKPHDLERMQQRVCTRFRGCHLLEGAGHWVQQEQPEKVAALLREFLRDLPAP
ncbi:MAG: alpha/beta hydrolase [Betaproteobacteria bacterium SG8_39]|nr:MAG: alpha/beta hydrolase [Betaproteobacteria bacterium SG8_39]